MSLSPYTYNTTGHQGHRQPQKMLFEPTPLAPPRSPDCEAQILAALQDIKAALQPPTPITAQTETQVSVLERLTSPLFELLRLARI